MAGFAKTVLAAMAVLLVSLVSLSEARELLVGGNTNAWKIPPSSDQFDSLNQWAQRSRFVIGDFLVWKYDGKEDSVVEVSREGYMSCNASSPIAEYKDGNTKVKLDRSGPFYFISGAPGHCQKGQKLIVVVLSARHHLRSHFGVAPAPSPAEFEGGPAVARTSGGATLQGGFVFGLGVLAAFILNI